MIPYNLRVIHRRIRSSSLNLFLSRCCYHSGNGVYGHRPDLDRVTGNGPGINAEVDRNKSASPNVYRLVENFRAHGHRISLIDPLIEPEKTDDISVPEIDASRYGLSNHTKYDPKGIVHWKSVQEKDQVSVEETLDLLQKTYTSRTGFEFMHLETEQEREWMAFQVENTMQDEVSPEYKVELAIEMAKCQNFDHFLASKFPNLKRYGGEGCESSIAIFRELMNLSSSLGIDHAVIGIAHRGRLNIMTCFLNFSPCRMFQKMKGFPEFPPTARATGDVLTHLYNSVDIKSVDNHNVRFSLLPNPSHLEVVNPVAVGKARAKLKELNRYDYASPRSSPNDLNPSVLPIQIHGDAAFAGQGINQELLGLANVPNYRVGGSLHIITNNQIGFTTPAERARSSRYASDVAKMINAPVIHVNGDFPEEIVKATRIALKYRQTFHRDVFLDIMCFRKWGHNEVDDPTFTNPIMYERINSRKSIPDKYSELLISQGILDESQYKQAVEAHTAHLNEEFKKTDSFTPPAFYLQKQWSGINQAGEVITEWDTGIDISLLKYIGHRSVQYPKNFNIHPHLAKTYVKSRISKVEEGEKIDWATGEALAFGTLMYQGYDVRLSGEDVGRGTFSQRHAMLVDQKTGEIVIPLNDLIDEGESWNAKLGKLEVCNSTLSEEAVLAFEYGFSTESPNNLVIWEAQFGDFFNGAQIVVDNMITSGEIKWMMHSGIVMLLPHGLDGVGPEHSSCRLERFLQLTDSSEDSNEIVDGDHNNIQVVNPTTPAQYFHLLRRQMIRDFRKPLIVVAPKTVLRLSAATSSLLEMSPGTTFQPVLDDPIAKSSANQIKRVVFVTGKHYYALVEKRAELGRNDVALVRIESLCPFPVLELQEILKGYGNATEIIWSQEEHQNQGAWSFIKPRFENFLGCKIKYKGRHTLATPATGVGQVHRAEVEHIMKSTYE